MFKIAIVYRRAFKEIIIGKISGMRKYYYVCPRCGRCYNRYLPRRKMKCGFCSTAWKTRKAKGTRSAFSWTATLAFLAALVVVAFLLGRELGVWRSLQGKPISGEATNGSTDYIENAENVDAFEYVDDESTTVEENADETLEPANAVDDAAAE
ncbi:MAG: hypothetical protein IJ387_10040 [Thermoguttaceae bacterium]|nr:hypothetical protein [Thermoguttaceae bacterium]